MHDTDADGNDYFKCDFCMRAWAEDRPMVEGHKGSLICGSCLSLAYRMAVLADPPSGPMADLGSCVMCLQHKDRGAWESPMTTGTWICEECVRNSAKMLEKDKEITWTRPV